MNLVYYKLSHLDAEDCFCLFGWLVLMVKRGHSGNVMEETFSVGKFVSEFMNEHGGV